MTIYRKILLAADGSPNSLMAAEAAASLARLVPDSTVTVLHVLHLPEVMVPGLDIPVDSMIRNAARSVLNATIATMNLPDVQVKTEVQVGNPATEIVEMARAVPFDLIVMGTRGLSPLKEILLGGVSHRVTSTAPCPVLLVR
jgi:nucleotide-binding universal stress UspA family protein